MLSCVKRNNIVALCVYSMIPILLLHFNSLSQTPIQYSEIISSVNKKLPEAELIQKIEKQKVDFALNTSDSINLRHAGASDQLFLVIRAHRILSKLPITFNGWQPFGDIAIAPWNKNTTVLCKGKSNAYPGLTTSKIFNVTNKTTVVLKIEGSAGSTFTNQNKMLKVFISEPKVALQCTVDSLVATDDREFILKNDGEFRYRIPEYSITDGSIRKMGIQFGPGEYKTIKISAWFE